MIVSLHHLHLYNQINKLKVWIFLIYLEQIVYKLLQNELITILTSNSLTIHLRFFKKNVCAKVNIFF